VALTLSLLAMLHQSSGDYSKAEKLYKRSITICEKNYHKSPENLANSLSNLGALYADAGDYEKAEALYQRALAIVENTKGTENSSVASILNNLALLYYYLNDFDKSEKLYQRTLAIWEKTLGKNHLNVATSLDNLAMLYESSEKYVKAKKLYDRALSIRESSLAPDHPDIFRTLNNLATLFMFLEDFEKAEKLFDRVLVNKQNTIGIHTASYANSLHNLAVLYRIMGNFQKAEKMLSQATEIWEETLGPEHPNVATGLAHLSVLHANQGAYEKAYDLILHTLDIEDKLLDQVMGFTSEDQKLKFVSMNNWSLYDFLNLVNQHLRQDSGKIKNALNVWLKRKGAILEVQKRYQEAIFYDRSPETAKLFQDLSGVRARLSNLTFVQPGTKNEQTYKQKKTDLENEKDRLEARLSRLSRPFAIKQEEIRADCEKIARMLSPQTVLVEFAKIETIKSKKNDKEILQDRYISFVLHAGGGNLVSMIDLGDADKIDKMITQYKRELSESGNAQKDVAIKSSQKLYDLVFRPLIKDLRTVKEIFISPDGNLNLIPFEVLQRPDGRFLIEDYTFNYLASGRDIIGFGKIPSNGGKYLLMGDPDFNLGSNEKTAVLDRIKIKNNLETLLVKRSANFNEISFEPLYYAREELDKIGDIMGKEKSEIYTGKEALEEILMNNPGPEILHLATHGFFLNDQDFSCSGRGWQTTELPEQHKSLSDRTDKIINVENPLLRSGFLLAGAEQSLISSDTGKNDGIVTAEKILGLNLHGTKMVVLSACDTGLGDVKSGEGVFGLRRAFTQAGAKSLVMSLWKVPDRETKELMVRFYRNIKSGAMNRCQALRKAALSQIDIVRQRYGHASPRYWGAFVFLGEP